MSQNLLLDSQGDFTPESTSDTLPRPTPDQTDAVQVLTRALHSSPTFTQPVGPSHRRRPFDAQYWACWMVAVVWPLLMAYLLVTR